MAVAGRMGIEVRREMIHAHLNGGPLDDQYVVLESIVFWVARTPKQFAWGLPEESIPMAVQKGHYGIRLDSNGMPVPHSLNGEAEFDWKGWE